MELAKGESLQAAGVAMHVLADTWAHRYFAGTPSLVINNTNSYFYELFQEDDHFIEKKLTFRHSASLPDDLDESIYTSSLYSYSENSIMNLGHGRAGHLPDYSFIRYKYLPAWGQYEELVKDNPSDYWHAFCQMVYALKCLRDDAEKFACGQYDKESVKPHENTIRQIITKRQLDASSDWKAFGEKLSGKEIPHFNVSLYNEEYRCAAPEKKNETFIGKFILAALAQKSMVTNRIFKSGSKLAGYSADFNKSGFRGIMDYKQLLQYQGGDDKK